MRKPPGAFEIRETDLLGRIGRLHTKTGTVETPAFFPVIDVYRQEVPPEDLYRAGFEQAITNAYLTLRRFGEEAVEKGIHGITGFNGVIMTDSGAYQILEYGDIGVTQEEIIEYQKRIGSDIAVILDVPTSDTKRDSVIASVEKTLQRAREALPLIKDSEQAWVLPVQGAAYQDVLEESAKRSLPLTEHYQILGLGGLTVFMETYDYLTVARALITARRILPLGKPLHLFGAGHPLIITLAIALGADTFDSASYILYARDDRYITEYGVERLDRLEYLPCNCPVCSKYTPKDLLEMDKEERTRLLALHNLYAIRKAIQRAKQAIKEGRLWELLEEIAHRHPAVYEAFQILHDHRRFIEQGSPTSKGVVRGLKLYGPESIWHPKITRYRRKIENYLAGRRASKIILEPYPSDPSQCRPKYNNNVILLYYTPYLGVVPSELCGVYPTIHFNYPRRRIPLPVVAEAVDYVARLIHKYYSGSQVEIESVEGEGWTTQFNRLLRERLQSERRESSGYI
ncbi:MAG: tRNA guanosine(15) transglycosylase TgtA [Desulfurococcales archaeon]|nr:tRNA guanosine(15) transglycosylase TgtA [Desulfurococcales archaeon]